MMGEGDVVWERKNETKRQGILCAGVGFHFNSFAQTMDKRTFRHLRDTVSYPKTHRTLVFVAAVVRRGKVIAMATNRVSASARAVACATTVAFDGTCTVHAERAVVRQAGVKQLRNACIVVWRDNKKASAPCKACHAFLCKCIRDWGLRGVFYTAPSEPSGCK